MNFESKLFWWQHQSISFRPFDFETQRKCFSTFTFKFTHCSDRIFSLLSTNRWEHFCCPLLANKKCSTTTCHEKWNRTEIHIAAGHRSIDFDVNSAIHNLINRRPISRRHRARWNILKTWIEHHVRANSTERSENQPRQWKKL